jgi:pimeloyl-ACP methyl ester carboxylesterase
VPTVVVGSGPLEYTHVPAATPGSPPLVFVHEGLGSVSQWRDFPDRLRAATGGAEVIVYGRHGHGRSGPRAQSTPSMPYEATAILPALLERLGVRRPILVGHSDGATIALLYAAAGFDAAGVVAIAPHVLVEACTIAGIEDAAVTYDVGRADPDGLRARLARHHDDVDSMFAGWRDMWRQLHRQGWHITAPLEAITVPVLLVQGTDDAYGTAAQLDAVQTHVHGTVERLELPGVGHAPHLEAADDVTSAIAAFARRCHGPEPSSTLAAGIDSCQSVTDSGGEVAARGCTNP